MRHPVRIADCISEPVVYDRSKLTAVDELSRAHVNLFCVLLRLTWSFG